MSTAQETHTQTHQLDSPPASPPPPSAAPLLDLDALVPTRPQVKFPGGKLFELTVLSDLGFVELKQIEKLSEKVADLQTRSGDLSADEVLMVKDALDRLTLLLVREADPAEVNALDDYQKLAIAQNFNRMLPTRKEGEESPPFQTSER